MSVSYNDRYCLFCGFALHQYRLTNACASSAGGGTPPLLNYLSQLVKISFGGVVLSRGRPRVAPTRLYRVLRLFFSAVFVSGGGSFSDKPEVFVGATRGRPQYDQRSNNIRIKRQVALARPSFARSIFKRRRKVIGGNTN